MTNAGTLTVRGYVEDDTYVSAVSIAKQPLFVELAEPRLDFKREVTLRDGANSIDIVAVDLRGRLDRLFAQLALGLTRVTGKRFGLALSFGWFRHRWGALATLPKPTVQQSQKNKENPGAQVEGQVESHNQPLPLGGKWVWWKMG